MALIPNPTLWISNNEWESPIYLPLIMDQGWAGYGLSLSIRGLLKGEGGSAALSFDHLAFRFHEKKDVVEAVVDYLVKVGVLTVLDGVLSCPEIIKQIKEYEQKVEKLRANAKQKHSKRRAKQDKEKDKDKDKDKKPYPEDDSKVLLSADDLTILTEQLGKAKLKYLTKSLETLAQNQPRKFATYKSHKATLLNWDRLKAEKGLRFVEQGPEGPGYYPGWQVEKWEGRV